MSVTGHIVALLASLTPAQLRALAPAERQQLSNELERVNLLIFAAEREAAQKLKTALPVARNGEHAQ